MREKNGGGGKGCRKGEKGIFGKGEGISQVPAASFLVLCRSGIGTNSVGWARSEGRRRGSLKESEESFFICIRMETRG